MKPELFEQEFNRFLSERKKMGRRRLVPFTISFSFHFICMLALLLGTGKRVLSTSGQDFITGVLVIEQPGSGQPPGAGKPMRSPVKQNEPEARTESNPFEEAAKEEEKPVRIPDKLLPDEFSPREVPSRKNTAPRKSKKDKEVEKKGSSSKKGDQGMVTGIPGLPFGELSSGILAGGFSDSWYIQAILRIVHSNWENPFLDNPADQALATTVYFRILSNGRIENVKVESPSGNPYFDMAAERAVRRSALPPLPPDSGRDSLAVHYRFEYSEEGFSKELN